MRKTFSDYKGYVGTIEFDDEDNIHYGKLINIKDFVNYHGNTVEELYDNFKNAVDDYIDFKKEIYDAKGW